MIGMTIVAGLATLLLGLAVAAVMIRDRHRGALRERVGEAIGVSSGSRLPTQTMLRLDGVPGRSAGLRWVPAPLAKFVMTAFDRTGNRLTFLHLVLASGAGVLLTGLLVVRLLSLPPYLVATLALVAALGTPWALLKQAQSRFRFAFLNVFPDALDLIVRAIRAGLPVSEAIANVSQEVADPVGEEFRRVAEAMQIGIELEQELLRAADRIRVIEFRFFIVALALQRQTGGNLAETLENLSLTIRRRKDVRLRARALMSESRASAWLIALLPFIGGGADYFLNPNYIQMLFFDPRGNSILGAAIVSLAVGVLVMHIMIKRAMR